MQIEVQFFKLWLESLGLAQAYLMYLSAYDREFKSNHRQ